MASKCGLALNKVVTYKCKISNRNYPKILNLNFIKIFNSYLSSFMTSYRYEILAKKDAPQWVILAKKSTRQRKNGFSTLNLVPPTSRSIASFI